MIKPLQPGFARWKTGKPPLRALEKRSPFGGFATIFLHGKASHLVLRSLSLPYEPSSLAAPLCGGTIKLRLSAMQHLRHKSQSRNADFILIAAKR